METALAKVSSDIIKTADRCDVSSLMDLSTSFDTVDHGILLQRLHINHHINVHALYLFFRYVTGRRESLFYGRDTTSAALVKYGVPQLSVLGSLLFFLYRSDVPGVINELFV